MVSAIADVERLLENGDLLRAFDRADESVAVHPDSETLKHRGVLALARAGATERAAQVFREWGLANSSDADVRALEARIAKDRALGLSGDARRAALLHAAALYAGIDEREGGPYPAINRATLLFLAGERGEAEWIARRILADPQVAAGGDYWMLATRAEAHLLLAEREAARSDLASAASVPTAGLGARSSTRRQLRLLLSESGCSAADTEAILAPLAPPPVLHVVGVGSLKGRHGGRTVRIAIKEELARLRPGALFTSLSGPLEILFAEESLASGSELTVVLAAADVDVAAHAIDEAWRRRFLRCCRRARRIVTLAEDTSEDAASLMDYASRVAMGLALLRSSHLDGVALQVLLGDCSAHPAAMMWRADPGRRQVSVPIGSLAQSAEPGTPQARSCCAVVFGDLPAFSQMPERFLPIFWEEVMGAIGDVLGEADEAVALKKTWGDAVHVVVPDVRRAAEICLAVQDRLNAIDGAIVGRNGPPTMRIGAHYGPVFEGWDPVAAHRTFYGRALSRAARVEPITPPGTVYVTEAFAAILLLESGRDFDCTYVGRVPLAKGYGTFQMYALSAAAPRR